MPTYEYVCDHCGHEYEMFQSMKDDPVKTCPECGEEKARRLLGRGAGIIFKGSGFYETDYKRKSNGSANGSAGSDSASESKSGDSKPKESSKSESKPAAGAGKES